MPEPFIPICTDYKNSIYVIYKFYKQVSKDIYEYRRYELDNVLKMFKTEKACQEECDKLNIRI